MKQAILQSILICLISSNCFGQSAFDISFSAGNNGQVQNTFNDFYLGYLHSITESKYSFTGRNKTDELKYSIYAGICLPKMYKLEFGFGIGQFSKIGNNNLNSYTNVSTNSADAIFEKYSQQIGELNFSFSKLIRLDKFVIGIGLELAAIEFGTFKYESENKPTQILVPSGTSGGYYFPVLIKENQTTPGGSISGINNKITIQYYPLNWLYIFAGGKFGLLHADLGGDADYSYSYASPFSSGSPTYSGYSSARSVTNYENTFISSPSMEFGVGIKFKYSKKKG